MKNYSGHLHTGCKAIVTGASIDASGLRKRYIDTGILNFTTGRYPTGCMLGYLMEGNILKLIELFNERLKSKKRSKEIFVPHSNYGVDYHYLTKHDGTSMPILKHFILSFS